MNPAKFGERCKMPTPSQAQKWEGVETRRSGPKLHGNMVKV